MKTGHTLVTACALLLAGCGEPPAQELEQPAMLADSVLIQRGGAAATSLASGLIQPLTAELEQRGAAGAIDFCAGEAQRLTAAVQDSIGRDIELRRVTLRTRNPGNAPDSLDRRILEELHRAATERDSVPPFVLVHDGEHARYYRPLRIQPLCLQCHGPEEQLDPEVRRLLEEHYPGDRATGYAEGDLRGAIRVVMPRRAVH